MDNSEWGIEGVKFTTDYEFSPQRNYKKGLAFTFIGSFFFRSEERRVGKECRSRWSPYH